MTPSVGYSDAMATPRVAKELVGNTDFVVAQRAGPEVAHPRIIAGHAACGHLISGGHTAGSLRDGRGDLVVAAGALHRDRHLLRLPVHGRGALELGTVLDLLLRRAG